MLRELQIENIAVIEKAQIRFGCGLNVMTGETGAGKSMIIDSINAILGNRVSKDIVRTGTERALVFATFEDLPKHTLDFLEEIGYRTEDELILQREIQADGRTRCRINGNPVTAGMIKRICGMLLTIHGQHDNQDLLNKDRHLSVLDSYAGNEDLLRKYQNSYSALKEVEKALSRLRVNEAERDRTIDILRFQIEEITSADLSVGEEETLREIRQFGRNFEKLRGFLSRAYEAMSGSEELGGVTSLLSEVSYSLDKISDCSEELKQYAERARELEIQASDLALELRDRLETLEYDPAELERAEERLDLLYKLKRKYGSDISEILDFLKKAETSLSEIENAETHIGDLEQQRETLLAEAHKFAKDLTESRQKAAERFLTAVTEELQYLNMKGVKLSIERLKCDLRIDGADEIQFMISTNPGEPLKPLSKIASGGELSRIMLAIKNALAEKDEIGTLIFDEIDTGVSGSGAQKIGAKLLQAARNRQVICVTHSAPIAAYAQNHLFISKEVRDGRTYTTVRELCMEERVREVARIISGDYISEISLNNAAEMIDNASKYS